LPTPPTSWISRVWQEFHAGNLTRAHRDVLLTLRSYRGHGGLICPSHDTLADRANCHTSTVLRALHAARDLGLVRWTERRIRAAWRSLRTSNRYTLTDPEAPVMPRLRLTGRSAERIRQLCVAAPGFGVKAEDGQWRVPPPVALAALAISLNLKARGRRGLSAAEFARRTLDGVQTLRGRPDHRRQPGIAGPDRRRAGNQARRMVGASSPIPAARRRRRPGRGRRRSRSRHRDRGGGQCGRLIPRRPAHCCIG
jgi:hypothetical protein